MSRGADAIQRAMREREVVVLFETVENAVAPSTLIAARVCAATAMLAGSSWEDDARIRRALNRTPSASSLSAALRAWTRVDETTGDPDVRAATLCFAAGAARLVRTLQARYGDGARLLYARCLDAAVRAGPLPQRLALSGLTSSRDDFLWVIDRALHAIGRTGESIAIESRDLDRIETRRDQARARADAPGNARRIEDLAASELLTAAFLRLSGSPVPYRLLIAPFGALLDLATDGDPGITSLVLNDFAQALGDEPNFARAVAALEQPAPRRRR